MLAMPTNPYDWLDFLPEPSAEDRRRYWQQRRAIKNHPGLFYRTTSFMHRYLAARRLLQEDWHCAGIQDIMWALERECWWCERQLVGLVLW